MYDATAATELLERAIGYTRGTLASVTPADLERPTPCPLWRLADLFAHMADSLDALTEASSGLVPMTPPPTASRRTPPGDRVEELRTKACALLAAWTSPAAATVLVGGHHLDARLLIGAGALEIAVHGWDVGQATGTGQAIPDALAGALLPTAHALVTERDRGPRFGPVVPLPPGRPESEQLLAYCGRTPLQSHGPHWPLTGTNIG